MGVSLRRLGRTGSCLALVIGLLGPAGALAAVDVGGRGGASGATLVAARAPAGGPIGAVVRTVTGFLACGPVPLGRAHCTSEVVTDRRTLAAEPHAAGVPHARAGGAGGAGGAGPAGYGPGDLQSAYGLTAASATLGAGRTVAVVNAFDDPAAEADLAVYRARFGLPPCTTADGCFAKVDQNGGSSYPAGDAGWGTEISLDVQMVSAACPLCHILLVEAGSAERTDLGAAVNTAARLGAVAISNSYGGTETLADLADDLQYYDHPGVAIAASSGDGGLGAQYPASSPYVTAVGGTTLTRGGGTRGWSESAWVGSGSGCSVYEPRPAWQPPTVCATRSVADVSAVADPRTGVAVYDSFGASAGAAPLCGLLRIACPTGGWEVVGGTSVGAPLIASLYAMAGGGISAPYSHTGALNDVTSGTNDPANPGLLGLLGTPNCGTPQCNAGPGYDGPTGLGTPAGVGAF